MIPGIHFLISSPQTYNPVQKLFYYIVSSQSVIGAALTRNEYTNIYFAFANNSCYFFYLPGASSRSVNGPRSWWLHG